LQLDSFQRCAVLLAIRGFALDVLEGAERLMKPLWPLQLSIEALMIAGSSDVLLNLPFADLPGLRTVLKNLGSAVAFQ
jgi:hypothetical protein